LLKFTAIMILGLAALLAFGCTEGEKTVSLKFKYESGMKLNYKQVTKSSSQVFEGDSLTKDRSSEYDVSMVAHILSVDEDGTAELLDSTLWQWTEPSKTDSTKFDTVEKILVTTVFIQSNGKYVDIVVPEGEDRSPTWLKNYYEQGMPVFPSDELSIGYSWTQSTKVLLPDETLNATTTYRIKSLARESGYDCALIEYDGNMIIPMDKHVTDTSEYTGYDEIQMTGVTYFAYTDGIVVIEKQQWEITGHRIRHTFATDEMTDILVRTKAEVDYRLVSLERP